MHVFALLTVLLFQFKISSSLYVRGLLLRRFSALSAGFGGFSTTPQRNILDDASENAESVVTVTPDSNCPCGSSLPYGMCCKPYHKNELNTHDPVSLMKSRYSAYFLQNIDFVIESTSTTSPDYVAYIESPIGLRKGKKKWMKDIRKNMVDSYYYVRMQVDDVAMLNSDETKAIVTFRHLAIKKSDNVMYPVLEKATCVKVNGVWKYERSETMRPEPEQSQIMMEEWPLLSGIKIRSRDDSDGGSSVVETAPQ